MMSASLHSPDPRLPDSLQLFEVSLAHKISLTASLDWVDVAVTLGRPTQFQHVLSRLEPALPDHGLFVTPVEPGEGNVSSRFVIRVQDVSRLATIEQMNTLLASRFGLQAAVIARAEIALDARLRDGPLPAAHRDLARAGMHWYRSLAKPLASKVRLFGRNDAGRKVVCWVDEECKDVEHLVECLLWPMTLYIGNKTDPLCMRLYLKDRDRNKPLPPEQHRLRFELTVSSAGWKELGLPGPPTIEQFGKFGFAKAVRSYFNKRVFGGDVSSMERLLFQGLASAAMHPLARVDARQATPASVASPPVDSHRRAAYWPSSCADMEFNAQLYDALRDLKRRLKRGSRGKPAEKISVIS